MNHLPRSHSSDLCSGRDEAVAACRRCPAADDHHSPAFSRHSPEVPLWAALRGTPWWWGCHRYDEPLLWHLFT